MFFSQLEIADEKLWKDFAQTPINQKWWTYMAPLMETNADDSPVVQELTPVFEL
ncbi:L-rhamnose mutarotase [Enterococcus thailandicus]|uniref:L-rhamnose mutarotase n=1 Tax=Enterococcus thailandicus TaxID=417368 RepID=UPI003A599A7D